ncbi:MULTISPECIES: DUF1003 domain-containing protein [Flavobacterium]|uniref:Uncharacterized membrane protein n=1 Tax=Flavobacterium anhuiense TaxID=459526 RepID=A0ABY0LHV2_9FLAO|nr:MULTISPECIES: DUF1003 domain-containing protein [Flavobacterium]EJG03004.1 hypothetical protein FF52_02390 [Flavobacterium sp. F52]URM35155.1 DUF1003 domain-containing protein [Flavobacterium anhuiense]SCY19423.1 Uncharacterized membrane protein [Flavobacterium anhuiense]
MKNNQTFKSDISGISFPESEKIYGRAIHDPILGLIKKEYPDFDAEDCISINELNVYRQKYISNYLSSEIGALSAMEKNVISSLKEDKSIVSIVEEEEETRNLGQKVADKVADFGGSWTFIISFVVFISVWIGSNVFIFLNKGFDPYPFILLNLILSCVAALQAPVIMMSQNRQEEKDRNRAKKDFMINLKSELEIRLIHDKIDHLIMHQQQELIEIQKVQIEMMNDILDQIKK